MNVIKSTLRFSLERAPYTIGHMIYMEESGMPPDALAPIFFLVHEIHALSIATTTIGTIVGAADGHQILPECTT